MTWYEIFPKVLNMSLTASVVIVFVLLLRILLKKVPKVYSYALWIVVLFRLLCPVSVSAPISLLGLFDTPVVEREAGEGGVGGTSRVEYIPADIVHVAYPKVTLPIPVIDDVINEKLPQGEEQLVADPLEVPITFATYLWMLGILCLLGKSAFSYYQLRRKLVGALQLRGNIYLADHIRSPFVMGILRPRIYLPSALGEQEQEYIILHEQYHIRRLDPVFKMLALLALCMHWFNPLVWAAFVLSAKDMEMSCDEAVVRRLGEEIRADYSASLLNLATGGRILLGTPLAFGEGEPSGRIKNLARFRKPTVWITLAAGLLCVVGILVCVLNPAAAQDSLRLMEWSTVGGNNQVTYEVEFGNQVMSATVTAERWTRGEPVRYSAPISLPRDTEEIRLMMRERRENGKVVGMDVQIDPAENIGSLLTYIPFSEETSAIGWSFAAYEKGEKVKVVPGEEKILAALAVDNGNGVRVFDCETLIKEPERLENADEMIVIRAVFRAEEVTRQKEEEVSASGDAAEVGDASASGDAAASGEALLVDHEPTNGQEWFRIFYAISKSMEQQYTEEELREYYPVTWLLLEMIGSGELDVEEPVSDEAIDWKKILQEYQKPNM